ncbi:hypothetical protein [Neoroseomonas oryzicola]|uniref:Uncharacterized protein n=1 Tax=Neoroseomonas oryzicola TaxID=535904 RepID=A0A9X9WIP9_9PROT|nr:hypothetical protein [Neoroseomonas oryzicola]MBR0660209.1 hypothetical protein [Neoroseomonas oryzicola]NKE16716.1 hypothetical protein [Neoroseomonas oryzicola]
MATLAEGIAALERRLAELRVGAMHLRCLWCEDHETAEEVIARAYPEGVPATDYVVVYRWASSAEEVHRARMNSERYQGLSRAQLIAAFQAEGHGLAGGARGSG